jgi:uncharacterized repeat protein (TIGR01451 family)
VQVQGVLLGATKTVSGDFVTSGIVHYAILLNNTGNVASADNPGDELVDVLPAGLTLVSASATAGSAVADLAGIRAPWNGSVPAGGSVSISIQASIATSTGAISNQVDLHFDTNLDGSNGSDTVSDDPTPAELPMRRCLALPGRRNLSLLSGWVCC